MATPISAWDKAGASLIPSPTNKTRFPAFCSSLTLSSLSLGRTLAMTLSIPTDLATDSAVFSLSPVSMYVSIPIPCRALIAFLELGLSLSIKVRIPATLPPIDMQIVVLLSPTNELNFSRTSSETATSSSSSNFKFPASTS